MAHQKFVQPKTIERDRWSLCEQRGLFFLVLNPENRNEDETTENVVFLFLKTSADAILETEGGVRQWKTVLSMAASEMTDRRINCLHADQENERDNRSGFIQTFSPCGHTYVHAEDWKGWTSHKDLWNTQRWADCYGKHFKLRRVTILLQNVKNNSERIDLEALCVPTICGVPAKLELSIVRTMKNNVNLLFEDLHFQNGKSGNAKPSISNYRNIRDNKTPNKRCGVQLSTGIKREWQTNTAETVIP
ncbi:hypothetical protein T11_18525 [Trichinella zimbabwensis]|uniref:Uncharacterized protein n=1 Tax=Trichinella zimbabwensis TaxID=268475 RepID=A0A0V1I3P7_9BILA|nr:hypothetical protein T11_18525 [Trichinella zimbabwensis]